MDYFARDADISKCSHMTLFSGCPCTVQDVFRFINSKKKHILKLR